MNYNIVHAPSGPVPGSVEDTVLKLVSKNITLAQLTFFYNKFTDNGQITDKTTCWDVLEEIIKPETLRDQCCYMNVMLGKERKAKVAVTHWWGLPFKDLYLAIVEHATGIVNRAELESKVSARALGQECFDDAHTYWLYMFAANHHEEHDPGHPMCQSDKTEIVLSYMRSVLVAVDPELETINRMRCNLEIYMATKLERPLVFCGPLSELHKAGLSDVKPIQECKITADNEKSRLLEQIRISEGYEEFNKITGSAIKTAANKLALRHAIRECGMDRQKNTMGNLNALLSLDVDPNTRISRHDETPLVYAVQFGGMRTVSMLIESGASINVPSKGGFTALMYAVQLNRMEIFKALIDGNADVNAQATLGRTALIEAAERGHVGMVEALMLKGADASLADRDGCTACKFMPDLQTMLASKNSTGQDELLN